MSHWSPRLQNLKLFATKVEKVDCLIHSARINLKLNMDFDDIGMEFGFWKCRKSNVTTKMAKCIKEAFKYKYLEISLRSEKRIGLIGVDNYVQINKKSLKHIFTP